MIETRDEHGSKTTASDSWEKEYRSLSGLMTVATRLMTNEFHRRMDEAGYADIRLGAGNVFEHISPAGSTIASMAQRAGVTSQALVQTVDYLERLGYVMRTPDPTDRRAKLIQMTDQGKRMLDSAGQILLDMEASVRRTVGEARFQDLRDSMEQIIAILSRTDGEDVTGS